MSWPAPFFSLEGFQWNNSHRAVTLYANSVFCWNLSGRPYRGTLDLSVCSRNRMSWWLSSSPKTYSWVVCQLELRSMLGERSFKPVLPVVHVPTHRPFADSVLTSQGQSDIFPPDATLCSAQATVGTERWHHCSPWCFACLDPFRHDVLVNRQLASDIPLFMKTFALGVMLSSFWGLLKAVETCKILWFFLTFSSSLNFFGFFFPLSPHLH